MRLSPLLCPKPYFKEILTGCLLCYNSLYFIRTLYLVYIMKIRKLVFVFTEYLSRNTILYIDITYTINIKLHTQLKHYLDTKDIITNSGDMYMLNLVDNNDRFMLLLLILPFVLFVLFFVLSSVFNSIIKTLLIKSIK